ncbi:Asp23/Gls24 family envelope stress response protein [Chitinophaga niabensis]|uniref:Uncharacterized protein n=1 Tax=Chitinophaga niabensis TaxID=536979 RepID=A0A1N6ERV2_9BACT|nr:hypothetical protein [Chitinophaga niabensis]SIN85663.1 hypothetical protein SAMN04488055_1783 [Chitinophaga niabensis]
MSNFWRFIIFLVGLVLLILPFFVFYVKFGNNQLSDDIEDWANLGEYLNGTFMPLIALAGVLITLLLGTIADQRNQSNIILDQQKQRPLMHVGYFDGEDKIKLFMQNKGIGPLIINNYYLEDRDSGEIKDGIFNCLSGIATMFDNYTGNLNNVVLSPQEKYELLKYSIHDLEESYLLKFEEDRTTLRRTLGRYKLIIEYSDVYNNRMPQYERDLIWFDRH